MNDFRSRVLSGGTPDPGKLLKGKKPRNRMAGDSLEAVNVPRQEGRTANHRDGDRHRLPDESVIARHSRDRHECRLINLSGGGAMIEGPFRPEMWDRVDLELGTGSAIECAVRWLKGGRIGLEFAHETQIDADPLLREGILRAVIARSFPDVASAAMPAPAQEPGEPHNSNNRETGQPSRRAEPRHPLIWMGEVHFDHDTHAVRVRNISASGAMVETAAPLSAGSELHLYLAEAGALFATVSWVRGDQAGLAFKSPFDLMQLARAKPQLTPGRWTKPEYLRDENTETSPWAAQWGRLSLPELRDTLRR